MDQFELSLFYSGACPFSNAQTLPPAFAQVLETGSSLLQPRMGQLKLTPSERDSAQSIEATGNTHGITQLLRDCQALLNQLFERHMESIGERQGGSRIQRPGSQCCSLASSVCQSLHQKAQSFSPMAIVKPERVQGDTQAQGLLGFSLTRLRTRLAMRLLQEKAQCHSQVLLFHD